MTKGSLPRVGEIAIDLPVLGAALAATVVTGLLFGVLPVAIVNQSFARRFGPARRLAPGPPRLEGRSPRDA